MSLNVEKIKKTVDDLEMQLRKIPQLSKLQETLKFPIIYLLVGVLALSVVIIYVMSGLRAIAHLVGFIYPAWASLKAINSESKDDDTLWLAYWVIYGFFTVVESITDVLLFWIPFYELIKICFYVYLYQANGALVLYRTFLEPIVAMLEEKERKVKETIGSVRQVFDETNSAQNTSNSKTE